ncbi:MAG: hypothetical protein L6V81_07205 [Clostridium sp.]|nr:MAG: hypothetical protein L6V81_07205 [Clostridium sp.]
MCDVLEFDNNGTKELAVHIIFFTDKVQKEIEENPEYLEEKNYLKLNNIFMKRTNNEKNGSS